jgi:pimeloyl-ACP methyl ester carboxylesterase
MTVHGATGPVVVKLAGIAGGIRLYDEEVEAAASAGFRVAAVDVAGDRHDDPRGIPLDWDRYAREVVEAIDQVPAERAILWGTSFGCLIALAAAARHPERIAGLLLTHPPDPLRRRRAHVALLKFAERRSYPDLAVRFMFAFAFLGLTSWEGISPALWLRLPSLSRVAIRAATPAATVRRKLGLLFRDDPGLPPPAAAIPVEILAGAWDLVAPLAGARRIAACIPGAKLNVLRHSGHAGAFARPRAHSELVIAAMKRLAPIEP